MAKKSLADQALDVIAAAMNDPQATVSERLKAAATLLAHAAPKTDPAPPKWAALDDIREEIERLMSDA